MGGEGDVVFPPIYGPVWLCSNNLCKVICVLVHWMTPPLKRNQYLNRVKTT